MRAHASAVVVALASCGLPAAPRQTAFPTFEPSATRDDGLTLAPLAYNSHVVTLRTSLGRAAIALEVRGVASQVIRSSTCDEPVSARVQRGCARCELVGDGDPIDGAVLAALTAAFDAYPAAALEATHIERVALCKTLAFEDLPDRAIGTVDLHQRRLLVSVAPFIGKHYDDDGIVTTGDIVHHELFHLLEFEHTPDVYRGDAEWTAHNAPSFVYTPAANDEPRRAGFINSYAATADIEDRASVFQYLMARSDELCAVAAGDEELRAKTRIVWRRAAAVIGDAVLREHAPCVTAWLDAASAR